MLKKKKEKTKKKEIGKKKEDKLDTMLIRLKRM